MEGVDLTKAMLNKGKQMASVAASAANGTGGKKRRKGTDLKPIVTNEANPAGDATASYVFFSFPSPLRAGLSLSIAKRHFFLGISSLTTRLGQ